MTIVLASGNPHKARELSEIFSEFDIALPKDYGIDFSYPEHGTTFRDNALGKAFALHEELTATLNADSEGGARSTVPPVVADDSGLCVDALDGAPGVYSARYGDPDGSRNLTDSDRNDLLLRELHGVSHRDAFYVCCMVCVLHPYRVLTAQETWHGRIAETPSAGTGGFGYDPVFYLPEDGLTVADLSAQDKNRRSHRGKASRVLYAALREAAALTR
jgi:XTP/dITP diphosphohydrolase